MAQTATDLPPNRHVPARTNGGWAVAIAIIVLAIVANTAAYLIHERTSSRSPRDPMFRAVGTPAEASPGAPSAGHGEAPAGQGGREGTGGDRH